MLGNKKLIMIGGLLAVMLSACSSDKPADKGTEGVASKEDVINQAMKEPVELTVFETSAVYPLEEWMEVKGNAIKKKYPNLSFKVIASAPGSTIPELLAAGVKLDLIKVTSTTMYSNIFDHNLQGDISDLIKKYNFDLNQLSPAAVEKLKQVGDGKIYGLPNVVSSAALFYNKDIFDRFGVPYPKDGMTWDETYELAKRVTRSDNGVNYQGFAATFSIMASTNQLSQGLLDPKTNKATFNNDNWKKIFNNLTRFHQIAGNPFVASPYAMFYTDQKLAMYAAVSGGSYPDPAKIDFRWDIVSMPTFSELPGVGPGGSFAYYFIPPTSTNRDQAFLALAETLSEEFLTDYARTGYLGPVNNKKLRESLGKGMPDLMNRNINAIVSENMALPYPTNQYETLISGELNTAYTSVAKGEKDVNTALREADEKANIKIQAALAGK